MSLAQVRTLKRQLNKILAANAQRSIWFGTSNQLKLLPPLKRQGFRYVYIIDIED